MSKHKSKCCRKYRRKKACAQCPLVAHLAGKKVKKKTRRRLEREIAEGRHSKIAA